MKKAGEEEEEEPHLQQVLDVPLLSRCLDAEQRAAVHLAGLRGLLEGHAAPHVVEICDLVARTPWVT